MSKACNNGVGSGLRVSTILDRDRQPHDTPVVKFLSYNEGSWYVSITRTLNGFPRLKNLTRE